MRLLRESMASVQAEDPLVEAMRRAPEAPPDPAPSAFVQMLLQCVGAMIPPAPAGVEGTNQPVHSGPCSPSSNSPQDHDFLAPAQEPGDLGRLGPYRILRVLGAGGMGVVFEAGQLGLHCRVAVKAMKPALAASALCPECFSAAQGWVVAALRNQDHIVHIYHVSQEGNIPFLVMQLLQGETLAAVLRREGTLQVHDVLRLGGEIATGLAAAHQRGLVHRDIKPAEHLPRSCTDGKRRDK